MDFPDASFSGVPGKTSEKRKAGSSLASSAKKRVDVDSEVDQKVCLIAHVDDRMSTIERSHILRGATAEGKLARLEWSWNMGKNTLDLDSSQNFEYLNVSLHRWYDGWEDDRPVGWFWAPANLDAHQALLAMEHRYATYDGTDQVSTNARLDPAEFYADRQFEYRLVPFKGMKNCFDVRQYPYDKMLAPFDPALITDFVYPFKDLGLFKLRASLHFIIVDAGHKLEMAYGDAPLPQMDDNLQWLGPVGIQALEGIRRIYRAWMSAPMEAGWDPLAPSPSLDTRDARDPQDPQDPQGDRDHPGRSLRTRTIHPRTLGPRDRGHDAGGGGSTWPFGQADSGASWGPAPPAPAGQYPFRQ